MEGDFSKYLFAADAQDDDIAVKPAKLSRNGRCTVGKGLQQQIFDLEKKIIKCQADIESENIRSSLLSHGYKRKSHLISQVDEISKCIQEKYNVFTKLLSSASSKPTYYSRKTPLESGISQLPGFESPCMRCVRETCEAISSHFNEGFSLAAGLPVDKSSENSKDKLWSMTENILHNYTPHEISQALVSNIHESKCNLKDISSRIDLKRDASNLRFKFETGKLHDVSSTPVLLQTVQQLIEEGQIKHFERFLRCEKATNEAHSLEKKLQLLNEQISDGLEQKFNHEDCKKFRKLLHLEQEKSSLSASSMLLQEEIASMKLERQEKENSMNKLLRKYNKIQNFDKTVQSKQSMIQNLIKSNGSSKNRHNQQHQDIVVLVEQKLLKIQDEIENICDQLKEISNEEEERFMNVPIQNLLCLRNSIDSRKLVSDLSIHRFNQYYDQPGEIILQKVLEEIGIPFYTPSEKNLPLYAQLLEKVYENNQDTNESSKDLCLITECNITISNLRDQLSSQQYEELNTALPSIQESQRKSADIMTECVNFRNAAQIWWEQPAQGLVDWITEDGLTLPQYLDQFSSYVSTLRKMQLVG